MALKLQVFTPYDTNLTVYADLDGMIPEIGDKQEDFNYPETWAFDGTWEAWTRAAAYWLRKAAIELAKSGAVPVS